MLTWELLIDADMTEEDWQFSQPTSHNLLRIEQINPPPLGRFALGQATVSEFEFLDIKAYPARTEMTRITLDAVGVESRRLAIRYRYGEFPEGIPNTWQVRIYGSSAEFQPAINPAAVVITLDPRIAGAIPLEEKGIPLGVASLDENGFVEEDQLPSTGLAELVAANLEAVDALADQINSLPPPATLASLGAEPVGAESRANVYTDGKVGAITPLVPNSFVHFWGYGSRAFNGSTLKSFNYNTATAYDYYRYSTLASSAQGDIVEFDAPLKAGDYRLQIVHDRSNDRGITSIYVDGLLLGSIDCYNSSKIAVIRTDYNFSIAESGTHLFRFATHSKNSASSGYDFGASAIFVSPRPSAVPYQLIAAGDFSTYFASDGRRWQSDRNFSGGNSFDLEANVGAFTVTGTNDQRLYKFERSLENGSFTYTIPIVAGTYTLKLHFAENYHSAAGLRVGSVSINGSVALPSFDIFAQAGGKNKALIKTFDNLTFSTNLVLSFTNTLINAIELIRG